MANTTWYVTQFTFNAETYDKDAGGLLNASLRDGARAELEYVSGELYPGGVEQANASGEATIEIAEFQKGSLPPLGTVGNIVLTVQVEGGTTETETWYNMSFGGRDSSQGRASAGRSTYRWDYKGRGGVLGPTDAPA